MCLPDKVERRKNVDGNVRGGAANEARRWRQLLTCGSQDNKAWVGREKGVMVVQLSWPWV